MTPLRSYTRLRPVAKKWLERPDLLIREDGRTSGHRDDRIELPDGTWINGAAHRSCNSWKGSRRIPYNAN